MSRIVKKEICCAQCGTAVNTEMWTSINVTLDQNLRAKVMDESLFEWHCPQCGYRAQLIYPCLYHDMARKFMVYLIPNIEQESLCDPHVEEEFPELNGIKRRLAVNLNALKEKVLIFEAGLDDKAVELTKLALSEVVFKKTKQRVSSGFFCLLDRESNHVGFSFFLEGSVQPYYQATKVAVYDKAADIASQFAKDDPAAGFIKIDAQWAARVLDSYHNDTCNGGE